MDVEASLKNYRQSPAKVRQVVNAVKDLPLEQSLTQLRFMRKKAARPIYRLLISAISNAEHNFDLKKEDLAIKEMQVGPGRSLRRVKPRARGRADVMKRRSCHVRVILSDEKGKIEPPFAEATRG